MGKNGFEMPKGFSERINSGTGKTSSVISSITSNEGSNIKSFATDAQLTEDLYKELDLLNKNEELKKERSKINDNSSKNDELKEVNKKEVLYNLNDSFDEEMKVISNNEIIEKKIRDDQQKNSSDLFKENSESNVKDSNIKVRSAVKTRFDEIKNSMAQNAKLVTYDNLPLAKGIAVNDNLISVPQNRIIELADFMFRMVLDRNLVVPGEYNTLLYSIFNPRYRSAKHDVDLSYGVPENFKVDIKLYGHTKTVIVNSYTGFVNGTTEKIDNYYKVLTSMFDAKEADLTEINTVVKRYRSDDLAKTHVISYVKMKITEFGFEPEIRDYLIASFEKTLSDMNVPVIERRDEALRIEAMLMYERVNESLKEHSETNRIRDLVGKELLSAKKNYNQNNNQNYLGDGRKRK